MKVKVITN